MVEFVDAPRRRELLTPRQQQVLALVADGATDRLIARRLSISERTVRKHLDDVRTRFSLVNRVAAARWWLEGARGSEPSR